MVTPTVATLAELRVRQGRLAEAERLLAGREEHPSSLRALALLRIAEGRAADRGRTARAGPGRRRGPMHATQLLAPLVDARLAAGDHPGAADAARSLAELAQSSGIALVRARADLAAARVALATPAPCRDEGSSRTTRPRADEAARRALVGFGALGMPLDAGEARLALARALAGDAPELAREEARAARSRIPRARRVARDERRGRGAARSRRGNRRGAARDRRADRARAGGPRAARARHDERPHRARRSSSARRPPATTSAGC